MQKNKKVHIFYDFRGRRKQKFFKVVKKELDYQLFQTPESDLDPEVISLLMKLMKVYSAKSPPDGFEETEFLERFYHNIEFLKLPQTIDVKPQKPKNNYKFSLPVELFMAATAVMTVMLFAVISYADFGMGKFKITEEAGALHINAKNPFRVDIITEQQAGYEDFEVSESNPSITLQELEEKDYGQLYLPLELLNDPDYYKIHLLNSSNLNLLMVYESKDGDIFKLSVIESTEKSVNVVYYIGENFIQQDINCGWPGGKVYYNSATETTMVVFEAAERMYIIKSNLDTDRTLELVKTMEVYK